MGIRLVVGLGNPGPKYARTRHNVGFLLVDRLAEAAGAGWESFKSAPGEIARGDAFWLAKPMTWMNESGDFVQPFCHYYKIRPEEVLVCFDDVALPLGRLRLRPSGSAGGHNGMRSVIQRLGTDAVPRLRLGVGQPAGVDSADHVLSNFAGSEREALEDMLERAGKAAGAAASEGLEAAMNRYNVSNEAAP